MGYWLSSLILLLRRQSARFGPRKKSEEGRRLKIISRARGKSGNVATGSKTEVCQLINCCTFMFHLLSDCNVIFKAKNKQENLLTISVEMLKECSRNRKQHWRRKKQVETDSAKCTMLGDATLVPRTGTVACVSVWRTCVLTHSYLILV